MGGFLGKIPNTFIPLFVAIDIFVLLPIFVSLTEEMDKKERVHVIRQSIITAFAVGVAFVVIGKAIFSTLQITVNDFKVAGGLVLLIFAILDLLPYERRKTAARSNTVGVVPIGVPLIVGPAVLTTILILNDLYGVRATLLSLILNLLLTWAALLKARRVVRFLGQSGVVALSKIMAILLAAIAIMMIRMGVEGILKI